jgi:fatty-acyl-CoA synthase
LREIAVAPDQLHQDGIVRPVAEDAPFRRRIVGCGPVIPDMEVGIRGSAGTFLGEGTVGEICLCGPSVMRGYWEDEEATGAVIDGEWLHTGDLGFFHEGELFICGRLKDMIIVGGRNLYPEDYEHLAATVPGVRRGNAIAFGLAEHERMVVVAETPRSGDNAKEIARKLMEALRNGLPHAPHEVVLVTSGTLPKTSSGKVQRRLCRDWYRAGRLPVVATVGLA